MERRMPLVPVERPSTDRPCRVLALVPLLASLVASLLLGACSGGGPGSGGRSEETLADGTPLVRYEGLPLQTLVPDTLWRWDPWSDQEPETFTLIEEVLGVGSRLAVADNRGARVVIVDPAGPARRVVGRRGQGPGEFLTPATLALDGQTLWVGDVRLFRFDLFDAGGRPLREVAWPNGVSRISRFRVAPDGGLWYVGYGRAGDASLPQQTSLIRYAMAESATDTLITVPAEPRVTATLRLTNGARQNMDTSPLWVVTIRWDLQRRSAQTILAVASEPSYRIEVRDGTGVIGRILQVDGYQAPDEERILEWWVTRGFETEGPGGVLAMAGMVPTEESLREWPVAVSPQIIRDLRIDPEGRLWVLAATQDPGEKRCDIFSPDLEYLGSFPTARAPETFLEDGTAIIRVQDASLQPVFYGLRLR